MVDLILFGIFGLGTAAVGYGIGRYHGSNEPNDNDTVTVDTSETILSVLRPELEALRATNQSLAQRSERVEHLLTGGGGTRKGKFGETLTGYAIRSIIPADMVLEQFSVSSGSADLAVLRPDFVIDGLPGWKRIVVESKFTSASSNYVRQRVRECKKYLGLDGFEPFVLMAIPSEGVFIDVYTDCASTVEQAAKEGVYILSPASLIAFLNCLRQTVRKQEIADKADSVTEVLRGAGKDIQDTAEETLAATALLSKGTAQVQNGLGDINSGLTGLHALKAKVSRLNHILDKELY